MTDLFASKAEDWDKGDMKQMLSQAIGGAMVQGTQTKFTVSCEQTLN